MSIRAGVWLCALASAAGLAACGGTPPQEGAARPAVDSAALPPTPAAVAVVAMDTATNMPVGSVEVGPRPWGLAISPDGSRLYTANGPSNDVSVVDTTSLTVVARIAAGRSPWGVAIVPR
jgi:YVTN family beta-propeller protein